MGTSKILLNYKTPIPFFLFLLIPPPTVSTLTKTTADLLDSHRYNTFAQVCARALRNALKEQPRLAAEKRGVTTLRYQKWQDGKGGQQVHLGEGRGQRPVLGDLVRRVIDLRHSVMRHSGDDELAQHPVDEQGQ